MPEPPVQKRVLMAEPDPVSPDFRLPVVPGSRSPTRHRPHFLSPRAACPAKFVVPVTLPLVRFSSVIARPCA
jgi:hypothetical protein